MRSRLVAGLAVFGALALPGVAAAGNTEFPVPNLEPELNDIAPGLDGNVWFTEPTPNKIGRITAGGTVTEFSVPTANAKPYAIAAGPDGASWFTEQNAAKIGRITVGGTITEFPIPGSARDIVAGSDGALWYSRGSKVGRITTGGNVTEFDVALNADEIVNGPDGRLWFNGGVVGFAALGRVTTSGAFSAVPLPDPGIETGVVRLARGPDGAVWYTVAESLQFSQIEVGRVTPDGSATTFKRPRGLPLPEGLTGGPDGAVWFTENPCLVCSGGLTKIVRITSTGATREYLAPDQNAGAQAITTGPDKAIWFTAAGKIGRITTDTPAGPILDPRSPDDAATKVAVDAPVVAVFNKAMDKPSAQAAFSLKRTSDGAPVAGSFSWYGTNGLIFVPSAPLQPGTQYTVSVSGGARDAAGNALQNPETWMFITAGGPALTYIEPADGATNVAPNRFVTAFFDSPMDHAATQAAFSLKRTSDGAPVSGSFLWFGSGLFFTPTAPLDPGRQYTASVSAGARDTNGKPVANPTTWRFTTSIQPVVYYMSPASNATGVATGTKVVAVFNKPMNHATTEAAFSLAPTTDYRPVAGSFSWYGNALSFTASAPLEPDVLYRARVEDTATDTNGNRLYAPGSFWFFRTAPGAISSQAATSATAAPSTLSAADRAAARRAFAKRSAARALAAGRVFARRAQGG
jgi:virginiamycin B lyase